MDMSKYDLYIEIHPNYEDEAKHFLRFLQNTSKRHLIKFHYKKNLTGAYVVNIGSESNLKSDAFFQELVLNKALYYYACTLKSKKNIVKFVIKPIFQKILESRFEHTHEKLLKRHILGKVKETFIPGDLFEESGHRYENLFFRWDIGILGDYDFIKDLDDLLTEFMLKKIGAKKGEKSPNFHNIVSVCENRNLFFDDKEIKTAFLDTHELRTKGLHRLEKELKKEQVLLLASILYNYFQYYEDYLSSQKEKTIKHEGKYYRRIKYGDEYWLDAKGQRYLDDYGNPFNEYEMAGYSPCGDCGVLRGQFHISGCDIEQCPVCKEQKLGCGCDDYD